MRMPIVVVYLTCLQTAEAQGKTSVTDMPIDLPASFYEYHLKLLYPPPSGIRR
ncbi:MAG: hypothetical protein J7621_13000 [Niastella sp.]|nr:hypothetical protein [Niastella sp.]